MKTAIENNHAFAQTCPHLLKEDQLENPYLMLQEFFARLPLGGYRKELDIWFSACLHEQNRHPNPETMHYLFQEVQILFNALYLIVSTHIMSKPFPLTGTTYAQLQVPEQTPDTDNRCEEAYAQPYWLSLADREKPMDFLKTTMTLENIAHLRKGLQEWLESGLSEHECLADTDKSYSFDLYLQLQQIIEASYLILILN